MKHTKKMIMIPEMEYLTLLNMLKNRDEVGYEKASIDSKITKTLFDPSLDEQIKGKKYDKLIKQQQELRKVRDDEITRPQKVLLDKDQIHNILTDISKYLGVAPTQTIQTKASTSRIQRPQKIKKEKTPKRETDEEADNEEETDYETPRASPARQPEPARQQEPARQPDPKNKNYIIHPNYINDMKKIFKQNKANLKINDDGQIKDNRGKLVVGSNVNDILDYLVGYKSNKPIGSDFLLERIKNKTYFKQALDWSEYHRQRGEGKLPKLQLYKTIGLVRNKSKKTIKQPFKPQIWARI